MHSNRPKPSVRICSAALVLISLAASLPFAVSSTKLNETKNKNAQINQTISKTRSAERETLSPLASFHSPQLYSNGPPPQLVQEQQQQIEQYYAQAPPSNHYRQLASSSAQTQVALGVENQVANSPLGLPNDLSFDHSVALANMYQQSDQNQDQNGQPVPAMMSSQVQLQPQQSTPQVLASLYIDQFGNQQVRLPPNAQMGGGDVASSQMNADSISKNFYSPLQQQQQQPGPEQLYANSQHLATSQLRGGRAGDQDAKLTNRLTLATSGHGGGGGKSSLSNAQLMSLIDELKDFNNRQVDGVREVHDSFMSPAGNKMDDSADLNDNDDGDDIDIDPSSIDTRHSSASESAASEATNRPSANLKRNLGRNLSAASGRAKGQSKLARKGTRRNNNNNNSPDKVTADDVAKFAKFLMTKEGSNMRFQLGLERDSPDDGDLDADDERDALLESKESRMKKSPISKGVGNNNENSPRGDSNAHSADVAKQMDSLIENLAGTLNLAERAEDKLQKADARAEAKREQATGGRDKEDDNELEGDDKKARSKRNSRADKAQAKRTINGNVNKRKPSELAPKRDHDVQSQSKSAPPPLKQANQRQRHRNRGGSENLAKKLIRNELTEDRLESEAAPQIESELRTKSDKANDGSKLDKENAPKRKATLPRRHRRDSADAIEMGQGEQDEAYSKTDRDRDRSSLLHDLRKIRRDKSKTASFGALARVREPVLRQALDGQLGVRTESRPGGKLIVTSGRGQSLAIKLPERSHSSQVASHSEPASPQDLTIGSHPSDSKLNHVKLASGVPLKDEYPISERVSSQLNVLSSNLDRYFNDGFMSEIKSKAQLKPSGQPAAAEAEEQQQVDSSDINEQAAAGRQLAGDQDFDVDVGIDGRRESDEAEDENDRDEEESRGVASDEKKLDTGSKRPRSRSLRRRNSRKVRRRARRAGDNSQGQRRRPNQGHGVAGVKLTAQQVVEPAGETQPQDNERGSGSLDQRLSAGDEHLTFDSGGSGPIGGVDPVDGEAFDSPIGPDSDETDLLVVPTKGDKLVESSRESNNVVSKYGKKMSSKFYEEPEW